MKETPFQRRTVNKLKDLFPGLIVLRNNPQDLQGVPDVLLLYRDRWAALEFKRARSSSRRPNQDHYVSVMNDMSYAAFVHPGNEEDVLRDLQRTFGASR